MSAYNRSPLSEWELVGSDGRASIEDLHAPLSWTGNRVAILRGHDIFAPGSALDLIRRVFQVICQADTHLFLIKTDYPDRMLQFDAELLKAASNLGLGTTISSQEEADVRLKELCATPVALKFLVYQAEKEEIDLTRFLAHQGRSQGCRICDPDNPSSCDLVVHGGIRWVHFEIGSSLDHDLLQRLRLQCDRTDAVLTSDFFGAEQVKGILEQCNKPR